MRSLDGHIALVNTRALECAGITDSTPDPTDGEIDRDANGHATGLLYDGAIGSGLERTSRRPPWRRTPPSLKAAFGVMAKQGITTYLDASSGRTNSPRSRRSATPASSRCVPTWRCSSGRSSWNTRTRLLNHLDDLRGQYARPDITVDTVKLFFDGVIEYPTQTAAMIEPYG